MSQDLASLIQKVPCFEPLSARLRTTLAQLFSYEVVPPKATLFAQGETGDNFCILLQLAPIANPKKSPLPFSLDPWQTTFPKYQIRKLSLISKLHYALEVPLQRKAKGLFELREGGV